MRIEEAGGRGAGGSRRACLGLLILGIALRVGVFCVLAPQNNDNHFEVIRSIYIHGRLPVTGAFTQSYHPPLYHLLGAWLLGLGGLKTIQFFSLVCSLATLGVIYRLLRRLPWLDERFKPWCLALPALHPEFIIYTLVISNDTLSILLGTLLLDQGARCLERPSLGRQAVLAAELGLGLLTKFTFLAFCPPVALLIVLVNARAGLPRAVQARRLALLLLLAGALGCYKFVDNTVHYRDPLVNTLDFNPPWAADQRPTWLGPSSLFDVNVIKLVRNPVCSPSTIHSWPLMIYGSFWYSFIPECGFVGNIKGYAWIGGAIDALALAPTLLMIAGAVVVLTRMVSCRPRGPATAEDEWVFNAYAFAILALSLLLVLHAGRKYDVWSVFQGRLLFPAYPCFVLLVHEGLRLAARRRALGLAARAGLAALYLVFLIYLGAESRLAIREPFDPLRHYFAPLPGDPNYKSHLSDIGDR